MTAIINNAATARYGPLHDFSPDDIAVEVSTKLTGSLLMAARGIRGMHRAGVGGDIVFVTSAAAVWPWIQHLPYAAANAGPNTQPRILRLELEGTGIRAGVLRVGETGGTEFANRGLAMGGMPSELWFRRGLLRHHGTMMPENVADAMIAMVSLPPAFQYELLSVVPTAPVGDLPRGHRGLAAAVPGYAALTAIQEAELAGRSAARSERLNPGTGRRKRPLKQNVWRYLSDRIALNDGRRHEAGQVGVVPIGISRPKRS